MTEAVLAVGASGCSFRQGVMLTMAARQKMDVKSKKGRRVLVVVTAHTKSDDRVPLTR
jgi:hypothetical protein